MAPNASGMAAPPVAAAGQGRFESLKLSDLRPSPTNPRRQVDGDADSVLVNSVKAQGVLQAILVRPLPQGARLEGQPQLYEVVAGARRFAAAKAAGLAEIPARVVPMTDEQVVEAQIAENLHRKDVHPLDEAEGFRLMIARMRYTPESIAARIQKPIAFVARRLTLLNLLPKLQDEFLKGKLLLGHAELLSRLTALDQKEAEKHVFETRWRDQGTTAISVADLKGWVSSELHLDLGQAPWDLNDKTLCPGAGSCAACPKRTGSRPELFEDVKSKNICTDRTCFEEKRAAHVQRTIDEAKKKGVEMLKISDHYDTPPKGALGRGEWAPAGAKKCENTVQGILVKTANYDEEKLGSVSNICTNPQCSTHNPSRARQKLSPKELLSARLRNLEVEKTETRLKLLFWGVLNKVSPSLSTEDLRLVTRRLFERIWHDSKKVLARAYGWEDEFKAEHDEKKKEAKKKKVMGGFRPDWAEIGLAKIAEMKPAELSRFAVAATLTELLDPSAGNYRVDVGSETLESLAKERKVDVAAITREVEKTYREKAGEVKKKTVKSSSKSTAKKPVKTKTGKGAPSKLEKEAGDLVHKLHGGK